MLQKPGILLKKIRIFKSSTLVEFDDFLCLFAHLFFAAMPTKVCEGNRIFCESVDLKKNMKMPRFYMLQESGFSSFTSYIQNKTKFTFTHNNPQRFL